MKGFKLLTGDKEITGGIHAGITGIIITHKENISQILFNSLDDSGMLSYTWYSSNLVYGDKLTISYQHISKCSNPIQTLDYSNQEQMDKLALENYYRLREELKEEGVI